MNKQIAVGIVIGVISILGMAYRFQPQKEVSSADNVAQGGAALTSYLGVSQIIRRDASTDLLVAQATLEARGIPISANTGEVIVAGFEQVSIEVCLTARSAATAVVMRCATKGGNSTYWRSLETVDSTGASTVRTWTKTTSTQGDCWNWNFEVNAYKLRCVLYGTSANAGDKATYYMRLASPVGG